MNDQRNHQERSLWFLIPFIGILSVIGLSVPRLRTFAPKSIIITVNTNGSPYLGVVRLGNKTVRDCVLGAIRYCGTSNVVVAIPSMRVKDAHLTVDSFVKAGMQIERCVPVRDPSLGLPHGADEKK